MERKLAEREVEMKRRNEMMLGALKTLVEKGLASPDQVKQYNDLQQQMAEEQKALEEEKRRLTEMMTESAKRQRHTAKLEQELMTIIPLINEANMMASELGKHVKFEARLTVTENGHGLDDDLAMKAINIMIRMTSTTNNSEWNWSTVKFDTRIHLMRELYQSFLQFGPVRSFFSPSFLSQNIFIIGI